MPNSGILNKEVSDEPWRVERGDCVLVERSTDHGEECECLERKSELLQQNLYRANAR